ncbi:MAG: hypothetical protein HUJ26_09920 [Planctomycetaceae bacterium]|nr:hypothetical protein [Planctomycetaceae bacterium]
MKDKTIKERWLSKDAYKERWSDRSDALLSMFSEREEMDRRWTFSEYGCGPYVPFTKVVAANYDFAVTTYDLCEWEHGNAVLDLNTKSFIVEKTDVCVLSGVCEYLNDLPAVLDRLSQFHEHFLISYVCVPLRFLSRDKLYLPEIQTRVVKHGWRNHYDLRSMVSLLSSLGVISDLAPWNHQTLFYVRRYQQDL